MNVADLSICKCRYQSYISCIYYVYRRQTEEGTQRSYLTRANSKLASLPLLTASRQ